MVSRMNSSQGAWRVRGAPPRPHHKQTNTQRARQRGEHRRQKGKHKKHKAVAVRIKWMFRQIKHFPFSIKDNIGIQLIHEVHFVILNCFYISGCHCLNTILEYNIIPNIGWPFRLFVKRLILKCLAYIFIRWKYISPCFNKGVNEFYQTELFVHVL